MKKFKTGLLVSAIVLGFGACKDNSEKSFSGVIEDASMNTLVVVSDKGEKASFNTTDADKTGVNGILIGDTAKIFYTGKLEGTIKATKLEITPAQRPEITGSWIQPIPGMDGVQGIKIEKDGVASSINMATLVYQKWQQPDANTLILSAQSIGNKQTFEFSDTLQITKLTVDSLVLSKNGYAMRYARQK